MSYNKYPKGSEWRKWDLHIHTPETKKNDQFIGATPDEKWEKYIEDINNSTQEISVVGITDYFSIDNYFKFKKFATEGKITRPFDLIIPNIEIRVLPVTGSSTPINLHCIFNPKIDGEIETRFLNKLNFQYNESNYGANRIDLVRLGRAYSGNGSLGDDEAFQTGLDQYVISVDDLRGLFQKDSKLRDDTIIVVSNKTTDGVSGITQHADFFTAQNQSQLDATRRAIYQFSDAIFSSRPGDVLYFVGKGTDHKDTVIEKCRTLMPCFHGCDAHSNNKIFNPDQSRFCWIKADPTFEGLKQTLYEPEDRVKIQSSKPDVKNDRYVISELKFIDSGNLFGNHTIQLNENLNAIIGGKSSGKSLLLYSLAQSIDPEQVDRSSKRLGFEGYKFGSSTFDLEVTWRNGEKDLLTDSQNKNHKIIYIPQLYINYLVERNNKEELNNLIEGILLQDSSFKEFYDAKRAQINIVAKEVDGLLTNYLQIRVKGQEASQKSKELGKSDAILKGIEQLQAAILEGQKASNLTEAESKAYNDLVVEKATAEERLKKLNETESILTRILSEVHFSKIDLLGDTTADVPIKGKVDRILDEYMDVPAEVTLIRTRIQSDFDSLNSNLKTEIEKLELSAKREVLNKGLLEIAEKFKPHLVKLTGQEDLQKRTIQLEQEKQKLLQAQTTEKLLRTLSDDYTAIRARTAVLLNQRYELYKEIVLKINETKQDIGSEITLHCDLLFRREDFLLFDQGNKASIASDNIFYTLFDKEIVKYSEVLKMYEKNLMIQEGKLVVDKDNSIMLRAKVNLEDILRGLIHDGFRLDYTVTYKGDDLLSMSPGKKGTVLLILFLQISSSEYPILIDQPEDNLDNRTIYELLCKMIKKKKSERQIIIVSHNANLVVSTDTENIIVANQEGQDSLTQAGRYRFEYVNGSLELSFSKNALISRILHQQGIKEHVCDILEGGVDAFKQRELKYGLS